jgi:ATP-dependent Clp protease ATP-binding subunit ClpA
MLSKERRRFNKLEPRLNELIPGRAEENRTICEALIRWREKGENSEKPQVFFLAGPAGYGKSTIARTVAKELLHIHDLYEDPNHHRPPNLFYKYLPEVNWGLQSESFFEELLQFIHSCGAPVIILEEFDKVPENVHQKFLNIFDNQPMECVKKEKHARGYGHHHGGSEQEKVSVSRGHAIFFVTSNTGAQELETQDFAKDPKERLKENQKILGEKIVEAWGLPIKERLPEIIPIAPLSQQDFCLYLERRVKELKAIWIKEHKLGDVIVEESVIRWLSEKANSDKLSLRTAIELVDRKLGDGFQTIHKTEQSLKSKRVTMSMQEERVVTRLT